MRFSTAAAVVSLAVAVCLSATRSPAGAAPVERSPGGRAIAYVHDLVREQARQSGEARVLVVLGSPALPQAWARDWRDRGPAIGELARRVQGDAPHFRLRRQYQAFPFVAGAADERGLQELAASGVVEAVYPDREHHAVLAESGPLIGQPQAQAAGYDGAGIGIAVIDTGVDYTHPDLGAGFGAGKKVVGGYDFVNSDSDPMDDNGHGTYVAGIAAGTGTLYRGIAPKAKIIALKVLDSTGLGYSSDIIAAIDWCITNKASYNIKVANLSLSDDAEWRDPAECDADPEGQAVSEAVANGIVVAVASGNKGYTRGVGMPACVTDAIAVGASWDSGPDVDTPAYFSNRGELLDVYAPGIWITSARWSGDSEGSGLYLTGAGTSSAAPHVAGAAADVFQLLGAGATPSAVAARLTRTGVQIVDPATGVGTPRIDLVRAIDNEPTSGPDLVITAVSSTTSSGLQGAGISVSVTVKNQGGAGSAPCKALIAMSENSVASPQDPAVATADVPALASGASWSSGALSGSVPGVLPGSYSLIAFADSQCQIAEKDETNNGRVGSAFTVKSLSSYVQSTTIPASMLKGQTYPVSVTIWNDGTTPWTAAEGYALAAVSPLDNDTWGVSQVALPTSSVPVGGTVTFSFVVTAPTSPGLYPCHWQMVRGGHPFGEIATGAVKTRLLDDSQWGQAYSAISGDWVACEDYRISSSVTMSNLASGASVMLPDDIPFPRQSAYPYAPLPPYENFDISYQMFPDVSGSWVTWMVDDYPENVWNYQIAAANALDLSILPLRLTYQDKDAMFPAIDGTRVVWEDYRSDPDGMLGDNFLDDNPDIYICDLSDVTGPDDHFPPVHPLCTAPGPQFAPRISGNLVVWEDWRDSVNIQSDIYMYDLSVDSDGDGIPNWKESVKPSPDPAERNLTVSYWPEEFPDISQRTVVWMDLGRDTGVGGAIDLYARDVDSPTNVASVAIATDPPTFRYHPRIDYPLVVWEDYSNDANGPSTSGSLTDLLSDNSDIELHHMEAGFTVPIAASSTIEQWPDVSGNRVAYSKLRAVVTHTDQQGLPYDWPVFNIWVQQLPPEGMAGVCSFTDVPATFWAWKQIEAAAAAGVVQGYPEGDYQPTSTVTRDQMAVFIARAMCEGDANVPDGPETASFPDVPNTGYGADGTDPFWAYKYIEYAVANHVTVGYEDGLYHPDWEVTRGQMAAFMARAMCGGEEYVPDPPGSPRFPDVTEAVNSWCYKHVEYIAGQGVTLGYPDGLYHPEVNVARDQMAVYISRAFGYAD